MNADIQVVEIAAYLHDVTKILGDRKNHRGSTDSQRKTIEEKIVATANSVAQFQHPLTLFYAWYGRRQCSIDDGADGIENKLQRSWNKIEFEYVKNELKEKYNNLMQLLRER